MKKINIDFNLYFYGKISLHNICINLLFNTIRFLLSFYFFFIFLLYYLYYLLHYSFLHQTDQRYSIDHKVTKMDQVFIMMCTKDPYLADLFGV